MDRIQFLINVSFLQKGKNMFTVSVGNIGNIPCETKKEAAETFDEYVKQSKNNYGKAANENVCLMDEDGEPIQEYFVPQEECEICGGFAGIDTSPEGMICSECYLWVCTDCVDWKGMVILETKLVVCQKCTGEI